MVIAGLLSEVVMGFVLGLTIPHAGRRAELLLSTFGMLFVLFISVWTEGITLNASLWLLMGWLGVAIGITAGKVLRIRVERRMAGARLTESFSVIADYLELCDHYIHGQASLTSLEQAHRQVRERLGGFVLLESIRDLLDDLLDVSKFLADGGLTPTEEVAWRQTVDKTQNAVQSIR